MARTIAPHLTPAHLRKMFDSYDENHDGTLSRQEVEHALARLELPVTYAAQIFARVDTNGDGLLDFKEFEHYVHETEEEFRKLFDLIDTDGDGSISAKELALAMEKLHLHPTGSQFHQPIGVQEGVHHLVQLFKQHDSGNSGYFQTQVHSDITFEDFVTTMCLLRPVDMLEMYSHTSAMFETSTNSMLADLRVALGPLQPRPLSQPSEIAKRQASKFDDVLRMIMGGLSAVFAQSCVQPIETVKVRLQTEVKPAPGGANKTGHPLKYGTFSNGFSVILKKEGLRGLYKGMAPAAARDLSYSSLRFGLYIPIKKMMGNLSGESKGPEPLWSKIVSGGLAGGIGASIANPFDFLKARMQADSSANPLSMRAHFHNIVQADGVKGLWKGTSTTVTRAVVIGATTLSSYETIKSTLSVNFGLRAKGLPCITGSAIGAGLFVTLAVAPVDFARTRFMTSANIAQRQRALGLPVTTEVYSSGFDVIQKVVRKKGPLAVYRGLLPQWGARAPYCIVQFIVWEHLCKMVGLDTV